MAVPIITSGNGNPTYAFESPEGTEEIYVCTVLAVIGSPTVTFYLSGADANAFTIDNYGSLKPKILLDYENPVDTGTNNVYNVTVHAINTDGMDSQDLTITVTDAAELTLSFVVVVEGVAYTLVDPPVLENPTATYGVMNIATGEILVAAGTAFSDSGSLWQYGISADLTGVTLRYYIKAQVNDTVFYLPRTTAYVNSACLVVGRYTNSYQIEQQFGIDNVHKWLSIDDHDEAVDYAMRYYEFIRDAEDEVDDALRDGGADIPYASTEIPSLVRRLAASLAGIRAYEARGVTDVDADGQVNHRLTFQARWCASQLKAIRGGLLRLTPDEAQRYPEVVVEDVVASDDTETTYS